MSRRQKVREAFEIIGASGLAVVTVEQGNHYKIVVEANGKRRLLVLAASRSCPRALKNFRCDVHRLARELGAQSPA